MKVYIAQPTPGRFGGSTPLEAELTDNTVADFRMKAALERLGKGLAHQLKDQLTARVVGIDLHSVNFSLILESKDT